MLCGVVITVKLHVEFPDGITKHTQEQISYVLYLDIIDVIEFIQHCFIVNANNQIHE